LPSIIKVDQIQSDTGVMNLSSGLILFDQSNRRVGIENKTPQGTLDVGGVGGGQPGDLLVTTGSTTAEVVVGRLSGTGSDNTNFKVRNRINEVSLLAHAGNKTLQVGKSISVGGATPTLSGSGITFPATQDSSSDANTLDDYEEGTWTPTITRASVSPSLTVSNSGRYVKIGRQVTVWGTITITAVASQGTNVWIITSLPFAQSGQRGAMGSASNFSATSISASTNVTEVGDSNADNYFYCGNADGSITNANFQAGTLHFTVTYES
jgi:hypothetical protein